MKRACRLSESAIIYYLLALSGGLMDACSYLGRGHVFANAQTGNIMLFGINLAAGSLSEAVRYFVPVFSFAAGIVTAEIVRHQFKSKRGFRWEQAGVLVEAVILFAVGFMPQQMNLCANTLISLVCGIQVQSFRTLKGNPAATTMCIGNLRAGTQALADYFYTKDRRELKRAGLLFGMIGMFALGAVTGNIFINLMNERAILISGIILVICFLIMCIKGEIYETDTI